MAALAGRDQRRSAEAVRDRRVGAGLVDESQDVELPFGAGVEERVVEPVVLEVDVGARREEPPDGVGLARDRRHEQGGPARRVAGVDVRAPVEGRGDRGDVARSRRREELVIHGAVSCRCGGRPARRGERRREQDRERPEPRRRRPGPHPPRIAALATRSLGPAPPGPGDAPAAPAA